MNRRKSAKPLAVSDQIALREVLKAVRFENAVFTHVHEELADLPKSEKDVDAFIRRRTRLFIESWIVPTLEEMLNRKGKS